MTVKRVLQTHALAPAACSHPWSVGLSSIPFPFPPCLLARVQGTSLSMSVAVYAAGPPRAAAAHVFNPAPVPGFSRFSIILSRTALSRPIPAPITSFATRSTSPSVLLGVLLVGRDWFPSLSDTRLLLKQ